MTSVIPNQTHRRKLDPDVEADTIDFLHNLPIQFTSLAGLYRRASCQARYQRPAAYNTHYLALAENHQSPFWTADERLYNVVRHELTWVQWLGNYPQNGDNNL